MIGFTPACARSISARDLAVCWDNRQRVSDDSGTTIDRQVIDSVVGLLGLASVCRGF